MFERCGRANGGLVMGVNLDEVQIPHIFETLRVHIPNPSKEQSAGIVQEFNLGFIAFLCVLK